MVIQSGMRQALKLHPDSHCDAVTRIDVDVTRPSGRLELHYIVTGKISDLRLPPVQSPARADGLWQHTCFEAFVRIPPANAYFEFNFSPSALWAAFRFDGYRSGMRDADAFAAPVIEIQSNDARHEVQVSLATDALAGDQPWQLGLSAVIEEANGNKSYWALAHPPGKPDFHHSDCFALALPAPLQP
jgi:hypothetical protein